jgi:hypothetical protein
MRHITTVITKEDSREEEVANAWALAKSKISKWNIALHRGATDPVMETLSAWCRREMDHLRHGPSTVDATTWSARGPVLQDHKDWLHGVRQRPRMPETGSLDKLLNEKAATAQLSSALALFDKFIDKLTAGTDNLGPEESERPDDAMHAELSSCQGLGIPEQHAKIAERVLELLSEGAIMSDTPANLGMVLVSLLPNDDAVHAHEEASLNTSLWRDVEASKNTKDALVIGALAENNEMWAGAGEPCDFGGNRSDVSRCLQRFEDMESHIPDARRRPRRQLFPWGLGQ